MIDSILDAIISRFNATWDFVFDPLWVWYFWGIVALILAGIVAFFAPFKWVRAGLGVALLLIGAYIAGGRQMHGTMKEKLDEARRKARERQPDQENSNWFKWFQ